MALSNRTPSAMPAGRKPPLGIQPLDEPLLRAIEHLRLLSLFNSEVEQRLRKRSTTLLAMANSRLRQPGFPVTEDEARSTTPIPTRTTRPFSSPDEAAEDRRATKRQATSWPAANQGMDLDPSNTQMYGNAFLDSINSVQFPSHPYDVVSPTFAPDSHAAHTAHPDNQFYQAPDLGHTIPPIDPAINDPLWNLGFDNGSTPSMDQGQLATHGSYLDPGIPFSQDYAVNLAQAPLSLENLALGPSEDSFPQLVEPSAPQPPQNSSFSDIRSSGSNGPESSGSSHTHSSASQGSHNHTVFTQPPSSGHSHAHTFSNTEGTSQGDASIPHLVQMIASQALQTNPPKPTGPQLAQLVAKLQKGDLYSNFEREFIIRWFFGPEAQVPFESEVPMNTPRSPRRGERLDASWGKLSRTRFQEKRDEWALASQWKPLETAYCQIIMRFSVLADESAAVILERINKAVASAGILGIPDFQMKVEDLLAWVYGGESCWFSVVHPRARNAQQTTIRLAEMRYQTIRAPTPSVIAPSSQSNRSVRHRPALPPAEASSNAPPPSASHEAPVQASMQSLGQALDQPSGSSLVHEENDLIINPALPQVAEMHREQKLVTDADVQYARAKAAYLRTQAELTRLQVVDRIIERDFEMRERQRLASMEFIKNPGLDADLHKQAKDFLTSFMNNQLPAVDVPALVKTMTTGLPGIDQIADVFVNAPALAPGNSFDVAYAQASAGTNSVVPAASNRQLNNPRAN